MIRSLICYFLFAALAVMGVNVHAQIPEGWKIIEITNSPTLFDSVPDMNDRGQIVFVRALGPSATDTEIVLYDRGQLIQLTDDDVVDGFPRINNNGEIVWSRDLHGNGNLSIVRWRDGTLDVISDQPFRERDVDINDAGHMVWQGLLDGTASTSEVFLFDGISIRQITDDQFSNQVPRINAAGQIVWNRCDLSDESASQIMVYDNGSVRGLSDSGVPCGLPDLNDHLEVVWITAQYGVDLWSDGAIVHISFNGGRPSINNAGAISLSRWDPIDQVSAVWLFQNGLLTRLTGSSLDATPFALNDRGEIVFMRFPFFDIGLLTKPCFRADIDFDGDVDLVDFATIQNCWDETTPFGAECSEADLNVDGYVEAQDVEIFTQLLGGPKQ